MKIRYFSHASLQITTAEGVRLLSDPWLYDPIYGDMMWQFPKNVVSLDEFCDQDILYISHTHPDHFCERTLSHFKRDIPILIREYGGNIRMKRHLLDLGFTRVLEMAHRETQTPLGDIQVTMLHDDGAGIDSTLIVSDSQRTVFNQNDCFLAINDLKWIGEHFKIDFAALFFMGVGPFPGSFEMTREQKQLEVQKRRDACFARALETAKLVRAPRVLPYSSDMTWLRRQDLSSLNGALPLEFSKFVAMSCSPLDVYLMSPGESYGFTESPSEYKKYFRTRDEMEGAIQELRLLPENVKLMKDLEEWENSFEFDGEKFERFMNAYGRYSLDEKLFSGTYARIDIGLRVSGLPGTAESDRITHNFLIHFSSTERSIKISALEIGQLPTLHMRLTIPGSLLGMALSGACLFEDLVNCRYSIWRPGEFNHSEDLFWRFLSGFTDYLENIGEQPRMKERGALMLPRSISAQGV